MAGYVVVYKKAFGILHKILLDIDDFVRLDPSKIRIEQTFPGRPRSYCVPCYSSKKRLHNLIITAPTGKVIDHKNHDPMDCRKSNLRICTRQQNNANRRGWGKKKGQYKGVFFDPKNKTSPWRAHLGFKGKRLSRRCATELEAALQYDEWSTKLNGEFAYLNFPKPKKD